MPDADSKRIPPTMPRSCSQIPSRFLTSSHSPQHPSGGRLSGLALPVLLEVLRQQVRSPFHTLGNTRAFCPIFHFPGEETEVSREGVTTQLGKDGWGSPSPDLQALLPTHPPTHQGPSSSASWGVTSCPSLSPGCSPGLSDSGRGKWVIERKLHRLANLAPVVPPAVNSSKG